MKKVLLVGLLAVGIVAAVGYYHQAREREEKSLPGQIEKAKKQLHKVDNELLELRREQAEVEELVLEAKRHEEPLVERALALNERIQVLKDQPEAGEQLVSVAGESFPANEVRARRDAYFRDYQNTMESIKASRTNRTALEQVRDRIKAQCDRMVAEKREIQVGIAQLQAQYRELQLQQMRRRFHKDGEKSAAAEAKEIIANGKREIRIEKRALTLHETDAPERFDRVQPVKVENAVTVETHDFQKDVNFLNSK